MPNLNQTDPLQIQHEARAKIFWGDEPEEVVKFLRIQGLSYEQATALVETMSQERAATIRGIGIRKILFGSALVAVPVVAYFIFQRVGVLPLKLFAVAIMVGLWGAYQVLRGSILLAAPQMESGDVAEQ